MAGPRTLPRDVENPIPGSKANADLVASIKSPDLARMAMSGGERTSVGAEAGAPNGGELSDEEAQGLVQQANAPQGVGAPSAPTPQPELSDAEAQALIQQANGAGGQGSPYPGAPAPHESLLSQGAGALVQGLLGPLGLAGKISRAAGGGKEAPLGGRILAAFGKSPEARAQIFQKQTGLPTRIGEGGRVEFQRPGEAWAPVSPGYFKSLSSFVGHIAELSPEVLEAGVAGSVSAVGGVEGAAAGAPAGPVGMGLGAVAGASAAGAAGAASAVAAREGVAQLLGADPDASVGQEAAIAAGMGALMPVGGAVLRKPLGAAANYVVKKVEESAVGKAIKFGELQESFANLFEQITGGARPTLGQAGRLAEDAATGAERQLGERIGAVWDMAEKRFPNAKFQLAETQKTLEETLRDAGVRFVERPRITNSEPLRYAANYDQVAPEAKSLMKRLGSEWVELQENSGTTTEGLKRLYKVAGSESNFGSASVTPEAQTWRALYRSIRTDRGNVLSQATQGTELEPIAKSAFSDYADKIEALKALSRAAEKSPEKFAQSIFRDAETAQTAKSVLANSSDLSADATTGWDAVKGAWLNTHFNAARDAKTGIVDIPQFLASVMKNPDLAGVVLEKDAIGELQRLSGVMSRTTWGGLLQNPDSLQSGAVMKGVAKLLVSRGHPGFAVSAIAGMFGHDPKLLQLLQDKGILALAKEAKTLQERNLWLRSARMVNRILDASLPEVPSATGGLARIPVESAMVPVLLNAGTRPASEDAITQRQAMLRGYQTFLEHAQQRQRETQIALAQSPKPAQNAINPLAFARGARVHLGALRHHK